MGAAATVGLQQVISVTRKPIISLDFQAVGEDKTYIHDLALSESLPIEAEGPSPNAAFARWVNLNAHNGGSVPAKNCLSRMSLWKEGTESRCGADTGMAANESPH
jgi:hypothetical protein